MKLETMCCSLGQAKRLHELGISPDNTFFRWQFTEFETREGRDSTSWIVSKNYVPSSDKTVFYPAPTVAELGVMLPEWIANDTLRLEQWATERQARRAIQYRKNPGEFHPTDTPENAIFQRTEAGARADMLIYLLKYGYVTSEEANARLLNS
jgi:hypothetical protein